MSKMRLGHRVGRFAYGTRVKIGYQLYSRLKQWTDIDVLSELQIKDISWFNGVNRYYDKIAYLVCSRYKSLIKEISFSLEHFQNYRCKQIFFKYLFANHFIYAGILRRRFILRLLLQINCEGFVRILKSRETSVAYDATHKDI